VASPPDDTPSPNSILDSEPDHSRHHHATVLTRAPESATLAPANALWGVVVLASLRPIMPNGILEEMRTVEAGVAVCWLGNLSWLLCAGDRLIAFDLDLDSSKADPLHCRAQDSPVPTEELASMLDVQLITHEHGDHFNGPTSQVLAERSECLFVLPADCVAKARGIGVPDERIHVARPGQPFDLMGVHVAPQRAFHSGHETPNDCGYLLTLGEKTFLQPGDTKLLDDHLALTGVDVLFVSPTAHNTHIDGSVRLIAALEPDHIFPQHFGTYVEHEENMFWARGYPADLQAALPERMRMRFHMPAQGQVFVV